MRPLRGRELEVTKIGVGDLLKEEKTFRERRSGRVVRELVVRGKELVVVGSQEEGKWVVQREVRRGVKVELKGSCLIILSFLFQVHLYKLFTGYMSCINAY